MNYTDDVGINHREGKTPMTPRDDLRRGPKEKAIEAIKDGRKQEALRYLEELNEQFRPLHDRYGDWIQSLLGFIAEKLGEEAIEEALRKTFEEVYKERALSFSKMNHEEIIKRYCQSLRSHYSDFYVEEDEEQTVIVITYCGSGGRIQKEGKVFAKKTKKPHPWCFDKSEISYYCCHESVFNNEYNKLGLDFVRYDCCNQFDNEGRSIGSPCKWIFFKKI